MGCLPCFFTAAEDGTLTALAVPFAILWCAAWFRFGLFRGAEVAAVIVMAVFFVIALVTHLTDFLSSDSPLAYLVRTVALVVIPVLSIGMAISATHPRSERPAR